MSLSRDQRSITSKSNSNQLTIRNILLLRMKLDRLIFTVILRIWIFIYPVWSIMRIRIVKERNSGSSRHTTYFTTMTSRVLPLVFLRPSTVKRILLIIYLAFSFCSMKRVKYSIINNVIKKSDHMYNLTYII